MTVARIVMNSTHSLVMQGHHLIQIGIALLLFTSFEGFVIPALRAPRLGLSVHTLSTFQSLLMLAIGLMWPMLHLSSAASTAAFWLFVYSAFATLIPYVLAAVWGAGNSIMPLAAGTARGTPLQETVIKIVLCSAAPTGIVSFALMFWGLRVP